MGCATGSSIAKEGKTKPKMPAIDQHQLSQCGRNKMSMGWYYCIALNKITHCFIITKILIKNY